MSPIYLTDPCAQINAHSVFFMSFMICAKEIYHAMGVSMSMC